MSSVAMQPSVKTVHFFEAGNVYQHMFADRVHSLYMVDFHGDSDQASKRLDSIGTYAESACLAHFSHGARNPAFVSISGLMFDLKYDLRTGHATHLRVLRETVSSYTVYKTIEFGRLERSLQKRGLEAPPGTEDAGLNKKTRVVFVETGKGGRQRFETEGEDA